MEKKNRVAPIIKVQKEALIDFMAQHPNLRSGRLTAAFSFKDAKNLWHQLAEVLNAIPGGSQKDWSQWRKAWQDYKKNVKSKASRIKNDRNQTGRGPPIHEVFDPTETQVLDLITETEIEGINTVSESTVGFHFPNEENVRAGTSIEIPVETVSEENFTPLEGISEETKTSIDDHTYTFKHPTTPETKTKKTFQELNKARRLENSTD